MKSQNKNITHVNACEEVIIIQERGGAQEHHNQTMDEIYPVNNEDIPIKCNVVIN